jgi:hypothetical protein
VERFVTCMSFAPWDFVVDGFVPAVFLRLDISVSAGLLAGAFLGDGMGTSFMCRMTH